MPEPRVLDQAVIQRIGDEAWMSIQLSGMMIQLRMTPAELDELVEILHSVQAQMRLSADELAQVLAQRGISCPSPSK